MILARAIASVILGLTLLLGASPALANDHIRNVLKYHVMQVGYGKAVLIGDSYTEGLYPNTIDQYSIINAGVAGIGVDGMRELAQTILDVTKPNVIVVLLGVCDAIDACNAPITQAETTTWAVKYAALVDQLKSGGATVVPMTIIPLAKPGGDKWQVEVRNANKAIRDFNEWIKKIANRRGLPFVDTYAAWANQEGYMPQDFNFNIVHPNAQGFAKLYYNFLEALDKGYAHRANNAH